MIATIALALAACSTVGPDYQRPAGAVSERASATGGFASGGGPAFTSGPLPDHWWRLYQDAKLDALVGRALAANADLRVAAANIARARASLDIAEDARKPQTTLEAGPALDQESGIEHLLPGEALPPTFIYAAGASVSYQVDLVGQVRRSIEASRADVAASQAAYDSVRVTVAADTTRAYLDACSAGREIGVAQRALDLQKRTTALNRRLQQGGRGSSLDVTRSSAQQEQVRATFPVLLAARKLALFRLAVLIGRPPAEFDRDVATCVAEPHLARAIPIGDGAALLRRRPDIRRAEMELHAATARVGVATGDLYPKISLGGSLGSVGLLDSPLSSDSFKFSLGPLIRWEFPNRGRVRARIAGAQADVDAGYARFDGAVLTALRETESALTVYAQDLDRTAALRGARDQADKAARDAETLFRAGREGFLPVLDAQRTAIGADQTLAAAQTRLAADQVQLFLALGGGWEA